MSECERVDAGRPITHVATKADSPLTETIDRIMLDTGLAGLPALEH
ncbi:hypothetical protein [Streptomyces virginiae]